MSNFKLEFAGYVFPSGILPVDESGQQDLAEQAVPRRPGANTQDGRRTPRTIGIRGEFHAATTSDWETAKSALLDAVIGVVGDLYHGRDDRFYKQAQLESFSISDPAEGRLYGVIGSVSLTFKAARYPESFGTTTYEPALAPSGGSVSYLAVQGDAYTLPRWTVEVGVAGEGTITLTNLTTGDTVLISRVGGFGGGDTIVLDRDGYYVERNGSAEDGIIDRRIPRLKPGTNVIICSAIGGSLSVGVLEVAYEGRWK